MLGPLRVQGLCLKSQIISLVAARQNLPYLTLYETSAQDEFRDDRLRCVLATGSILIRLTSAVNTALLIADNSVVHLGMGCIGGNSIMSNTSDMIPLSILVWVASAFAICCK